MDDIVIKIITFIVFGLVGLIFVGAFFQQSRMVDLNNQCLADGRKEYECYAMLHGGSK